MSRRQFNQILVPTIAVVVFILLWELQIGRAHV